MLPTTRHYNAGINLLLVNIGGPGPFEFRGYLEADLPHALAVSLRAALSSNGWRNPVDERWCGCSLQR